MHSKQLKSIHAEVYQKFFMEHQFVASAPFVMNRSGDVLNHYSGISIKQKIPLRIYIGYARINTPQIRFNKITYLDINEERFIQSNILEYTPYFTELQKEIQKKYQHLTDIGGGIEINILSELPRGV